MNPKLLLIPLYAAIAGCDPSTLRQCGVFDHPDAELWQPLAAGAMTMFMSESGATLSFTASERILNEPFTGSDTGYDTNRVRCQLTSTQELVASDSSLSLRNILTQTELVTVDSGDEALIIKFKLEMPIGTASTGSAVAPLTGLDNIDRAVYFNTLRYFPTQEIDGVVYSDVIEIDVREFDIENDNSLYKQFKQLVVAKGVGLVSFTGNDDAVFVRVMP